MFLTQLHIILDYLYRYFVDYNTQHNYIVNAISVDSKLVRRYNF